MKLVTIVVPVYNVEKYIADTIQSVLVQTYQQFELLIVDDGSTDRSIEICKQFTDSRIKILQQENSGSAVARNLGIQNAQGEYIAFLDGKDLWQPDKLEKHVAHLERSPQVGVSFCPSVLIDENGQPLGKYPVSKLNQITELDLLCRTPIGNSSVPVIRRSVFDEIGIFKQTGSTQETYYLNPDQQLHPSEDIECWVRIVIRTQWKIEGIPEALTLCRVNAQDGLAHLQQKLKSWEQLLDEIHRHIPEKAHVWAAPAMASQLCHLARRAVSMREGEVAVDLMQRCLATDATILFKDFLYTMQTLVASYLLKFLPLDVYQRFEGLAMKVSGTTQKEMH